MKNKITRVCIVGNVFGLFEYLLCSTEDEIKHTYYFFAPGVIQSIRNKFPRQYFMDDSKMLYRPRRILRYLFFFFLKYIRWPFLRKSEIYGHDHLLFSPLIIGKRNYTLLEDAPKGMSAYLGTKFFNDTKILERKCPSYKKFLFGLISGLFYRPMGSNDQCKELILTVDDDNPYFTDEKKKHIIPLENTWKNISDKKKRLILDVFDVSSDDINALENKTHIIFTQQFSSDGFISEAEQIEIYKKIIKEYDPSTLVIKTHPRETVNYRHYFPDIYVFDKVVPMQLILLIGCSNFKKVITLFSSSINLFPETVEKVWIGSSVHPVLYKLFPNMKDNIYK